MGTRLQLARNITSVLKANTPSEGEPWYDTQTNELILGDGQTLGGIRQSIDADIEYKVPSDFPSLSSAVKYITRRKVTSEANVDILIETGHALASGLKLEGGDYSNITIKSEDATVLLAAGFSGDLFTMINCKAPNWGIVVDAEDKDFPLNIDGNYCAGLSYQYNSVGYILNGCGVKNVGGTSGLGVQCFVGWNSKVICQDGGVFTGSGQTNVWVTHLSLGYFGDSDFSGATSASNLFVSRGCICYCAQFTVANSLDKGITIYRSKVVAPGGGSIIGCANEAVVCEAGSDFIAHERNGLKLQVSNCGSGIKALRNTRCDVWKADFTNVAGTLLTAEGCSQIYADGLTASGSGSVADAVGAGSSIDCANANVVSGTSRVGSAKECATLNLNAGAFSCNTTGDAVGCSDGAVVNCNNATIAGSFGNCLLSIRSGVINAQELIGTGASSNGAKARFGGQINLTNANVRKGATDSPTDIVVETGSIISASNSTGGLSQTANTITASGIIFK